MGVLLVLIGLWVILSSRRLTHRAAILGSTLDRLSQNADQVEVSPAGEDHQDL